MRELRRKRFNWVVQLYCKGGREHIALVISKIYSIVVKIYLWLSAYPLAGNVTYLLLGFLYIEMKTNVVIYIYINSLKKGIT